MAKLARLSMFLLAFAVANAGCENDLEVNALKGKQLTNIRTTSKDEAVRLTTPKKLTLEQSLGYIAEDEYVEVTPKSIRLRKIWLDPNDRKRMSRAAKSA